MGYLRPLVQGASPEDDWRLRRPVFALAAGFTVLFGPGSAVRQVPALANAPKDGLAAAFDQSDKAADRDVVLHTETYAWSQDNLYVLLVIAGPRDLDTSEFAGETLDKAHSKVADALKLPK